MMDGNEGVYFPNKSSIADELIRHQAKVVLVINSFPRGERRAQQTQLGSTCAGTLVCETVKCCQNCTELIWPGQV